MTKIDWLGLCAGALTTIAFIPQLLKIWATKSAEDISYGMFSLFSTGVFLWLLYGITIASAPIIIANAITFVLAITILMLKIRFR